MTPLAELLARRIAETGPISVAEYMADCLLHPTLGYYTTAPVFGAEGDFVTAPEISQMFGEVIGLALAQCWIDQGRPADAVLAEIGPGRGTLMADALWAIKAIPGVADGLPVHLVEASSRLVAVQRDTLAGHAIQWSGTVDALPQAPLFVIANEFLDALPIRQFQRTSSGWCERLVGQAQGRLEMVLSDPLLRGTLRDREADTRPGDIVELCPALPEIVTALAERILAHGGAAIFIDYGGWHSLGDTLQAVRGHETVDPLSHPGQSDLTAHVDFEAVARAADAAGAAVTPMVPQGVFLERLGLTARARAIARNIDDADKLGNHIAAHRRLTHPQEMGSLFKAIAFHRPGTAAPPGFDT